MVNSSVISQSILMLPAILIKAKNGGITSSPFQNLLTLISLTLITFKYLLPS